MAERKFRTVLVIDTDNDPEGWSLGEFHSAIENDQGDLVSAAAAEPLLLAMSHEPTGARLQRELSEDVCRVPRGFFK